MRASTEKKPTESVCSITLENVLHCYCCLFIMRATITRQNNVNNYYKNKSFSNDQWSLINFLFYSIRVIFFFSHLIFLIYLLLLVIFFASKLFLFRYSVCFFLRLYLVSRVILWDLLKCNIRTQSACKYMNYI